MMIDPGGVSVPKLPLLRAATFADAGAPTILSQAPQLYGRRRADNAPWDRCDVEMLVAAINEQALCARTARSLV